MSVAAPDEVPFTELLRKPSATAGRLHAVRSLRLRRRDAEDLDLRTAERAMQEDEVIELSARFLAGMARDEAGAAVLRRVLPEALPWVALLPDGGTDELAAELVATLRASISLDNLWPVSQLLAEWRHTAEIYADPHLHAEATRRLGADAGLVSRPVAD